MPPDPPPRNPALASGVGGASPRMAGVKPILLLAAMFLVPLFGGILLGFVQLGVYRLLRSPAVPPFPILLGRGMLAVVAVAVAMAVLTHLAAGR